MYVSVAKHAPLGALTIYLYRGDNMFDEMNSVRWRKKFISRVQYYLEKYKMTQMELADLVHVNRSTITRYLTGEKDPSVKAVINIAMVFGCDVGDLIDFR